MRMFSEIELVKQCTKMVAEEKRSQKLRMEDAIRTIQKNYELTYGYREDVVAVLEWVIGGEQFDGLNIEDDGLGLDREFTKDMFHKD